MDRLRAEREAAIASSRDLRAILKANPTAVEPAEIQQQLDELKLYGAAGEHFRLAKQYASAKELTAFRALPLSEQARQLENWGAEGGVQVPASLRPILDKAAADTSVSVTSESGTK